MTEYLASRAATVLLLLVRNSETGDRAASDARATTSLSPVFLSATTEGHFSAVEPARDRVRSPAVDEGREGGGWGPDRVATPRDSRRGDPPNFFFFRTGKRSQGDRPPVEGGSASAAAAAFP